MFSATAELYDLIYSQFKDYQAEARALAERLWVELPGGRRLLDVACGTGEHARHLIEQYGYEVDGLDLDPEFVRLARAKLPGREVYQGDMTAFSLKRHYDAILCLFSSIGYVRTLDRLQAALECFRAHLAPGGIVVVEPWFEPGAIEPGRITVNQAEGGGKQVVRMATIAVEDRLSRLRMEYLIGSREGIRHVSETHELGLFTVAETLAAFEAAGLQATHDPKGLTGRGLYVARSVT